MKKSMINLKIIDLSMIFRHEFSQNRISAAIGEAA